MSKQIEAALDGFRQLLEQIVATKVPARKKPAASRKVKAEAVKKPARKKRVSVRDVETKVPKMVELADQGFSLNQIAKEIQVSPSAVSRRLIQARAGRKVRAVKLQQVAPLPAQKMNRRQRAAWAVPVVARLHFDEKMRIDLIAKHVQFSRSFVEKRIKEESDRRAKVAETVQGAMGAAELRAQSAQPTAENAGTPNFTLVKHN